MSTHCLIGIQNTDSTVDWIFCQHDGIPDRVGRMLKENYTDRNKVRDLIEMGDLQTLRPLVFPKDKIPLHDVCVFNRRDLNYSLDECKKVTRPFYAYPTKDFVPYHYLFTSADVWEFRCMYFYPLTENDMVEL